MVAENINETFSKCVNEHCDGCKDQLKNQLGHLCVASMKEKIQKCFRNALKQLDTDDIQKMKDACNAPVACYVDFQSTSFTQKKIQAVQNFLDFFHTGQKLVRFGKIKEHFKS